MFDSNLLNCFNLTCISKKKIELYTVEMFDSHYQALTSKILIFQLSNLPEVCCVRAWLLSVCGVFDACARYS